jgi:hypothetical protein
MSKSWKIFHILQKHELELQKHLARPTGCFTSAMYPPLTSRIFENTAQVRLPYREQNQE